jgi:hypothetical protein
MPRETAYGVDVMSLDSTAFHDFDPDRLEITPETSEAFMYLEPLSETVYVFPDSH